MRARRGERSPQDAQGGPMTRRWTHHYIAARKRGCNYDGALRYALARSNSDLIRSFR